LIKYIKMWYAFNKQREQEDKYVSEWFVLLEYLLFIFDILKIIVWDAPHMLIQTTEAEKEYKNEFKKFREEKV